MDLFYIFGSIVCVGLPVGLMLVLFVGSKMPPIKKPIKGSGDCHF